MEFSKENITYWTKRAPGYSEVNIEELETDQRSVWGRVIDQRIMERYPNRDRESIKVLDVGTGPGFFAIILAELGYDVTAVDYTEAMLAQAKHNAGAMVSRISFREMNAEELLFADHSFDVIVSRNVTWNLHNPANAYRQWFRVLKEDGLLLNFDANWYRYLYDAEAKSLHIADRANVEKYQVADENAGTDVDAMEAIARQTPLAKEMRPFWDLQTLTDLGMTTVADENIWQTVWTDTERINNSSTPMFMIHAIKQAIH
ncbi:MAG: class I SAM-dependent methyltransferase [Eubacteriales bacterium]|nr:class I SAM-dependent methyltransferase [Eubacteriales bacterium]